eukprot:14116673-Heterocapsa_arctica.AAC.1
MGAPHERACVNTVQSWSSVDGGGAASTPTHTVQRSTADEFTQPLLRASVGSGTAPGQRTTCEK